jgi:hypothetical protein
MRAHRLNALSDVVGLACGADHCLAWTSTGTAQRMPLRLLPPDHLDLGDDIGIGEFVVLGASGGLRIGSRVMIRDIRWLCRGTACRSTCRSRSEARLDRRRSLDRSPRRRTARRNGRSGS